MKSIERHRGRYPKQQMDYGTALGETKIQPIVAVAVSPLPSMPGDA